MSFPFQSSQSISIKSSSMYRPLEPDDYVSFFVLKGAGQSYRNIGLLFGCSATTVRKYLVNNYEFAKSEAERKYGRKERVCSSE